MPSVTITVTDAQAAAFTRELKRVNDDRARHGQASWTLQDLIISYTVGILAREKQDDVNAIRAALEDPVKAAAIKAAAGLP